MYDEGAYKVDIEAIAAAVPVLGICYGAQLMALSYGGKVEPAPSREYGRANLSYVDSACRLFDGIEPGAQVWMSHGDTITWQPSRRRPPCGACSSTPRSTTASAACACSKTSR